MSSDSTPPKFLRLHGAASRANDGSSSEPTRQRQTPARIRALARSALEERPPRASVATAAAAAADERIKRKLRFDAVGGGGGGGGGGGSGRDGGGSKIGTGGLSSSQSKADRIASIARRGLFPDERRLPKKTKSPSKKSVQLSATHERAASHNGIGTIAHSRDDSFVTGASTIDSFESTSSHGAERRMITSSFATTSLSGLSSSVKQNVYSSPPRRSYTPPAVATGAAASFTSAVESPVREYIEDALHPEMLPETSTGWLHACIDGNWRECHATADRHSRTLMLTNADGMAEVVQLKGTKAALSGRVTIGTRSMHEFRVAPTSGHSSRKGGNSRRLFAIPDQKLAVSWVAVLNGASGHAESVERARAERIAAEEEQARQEREERRRQRERPLSPPKVDVSMLAPLPPPVRSYYAEQYEEQQRVKRATLDRFVATRRLQAWGRGVMVRRNAVSIFWQQTYKNIARRCARDRSRRLAACRVQKWTRFIVISSAQKERYRLALRRALAIQIRELGQSAPLRRLGNESSDSVEWLTTYPANLLSVLHALHLQFNDASNQAISKQQHQKLMQTFSFVLPDAATFLRDHHASHCKAGTCRIIGAPRCVFPSAPRRLVKLAALVGELRHGVQELQQHLTFRVGTLDMLAGLQSGAFELAVEAYRNLPLADPGEQDPPTAAEASSPDPQAHPDMLDRAGALAKAEELARQWLSASLHHCIDDHDRLNDLKVAFAQLELASLLLEQGARGTFEGTTLVRRAAGTFRSWLRGLLYREHSMTGKVIRAWARAVKGHKTWRIWASRLERLEVVEELGGWAYGYHARSMMLRRSMRTWFGNGRLMARQRESMERAECLWEGVAAAQALDLLYLAAYDSQLRLTALSEQLLRLNKKRLLVRWAAERRHNATLRHRAEIRLRKFYGCWVNSMSTFRFEKRQAILLQSFVRGSLVYRQNQRDTEQRFHLFVSACSDQRRLVHRSQLWCGDACVTVESGLAHVENRKLSWQWLGLPALWVRCTDPLSGRSSMHHIGIKGLMRFAGSNEVSRPIAFNCLVRKLAKTVDWLASPGAEAADAEAVAAAADVEDERPVQVMRDGPPQRWSYAVDISSALGRMKDLCSEATRREDAHVARFEDITSELADAARRLKVGTREALSVLGGKLYREVREICFFEDVLAGKERALHRKPLGREEWTYAGGWIKRRELFTQDMVAFRALATECSNKYKAIVDTMRMLRRRHQLWGLLAKDLRFVRSALTASLDGNIAHVKDLADAALAYCRDALAALCSGSFAQRNESMHRFSSIREGAFELLNLQQRGMGRFEGVVQSQMATLDRDAEYLDRLTTPLVSDVEPCLASVRKSAASILEHFKKRLMIVGEVQAECRRNFAERMLKLYAPAKKGPKPYVPKPPRAEWVGVRTLPRKYVQVYQDLMDRGAKPRKTSRQRWDIVCDRAKSLNLTMERFVNAIKERTEIDIRPSTKMRMATALKNIQDVTKAMGQSSAHQAKAVRFRFQNCDKKVTELCAAFERDEVFAPDDNKEMRLLRQVMNGMPFILDKLEYIIRFPDRTAKGAPPPRRRQSMFGGAVATSNDGDNGDDDGDGEVGSPIRDTLNALKHKAFGKPVWKHPKHLLTDTSVRAAFITREQKENAAAILMQASSRRLLHVWHTIQEQKVQSAMVVQRAVRVRQAYRLLNGKRICRFIHSRKEFERRKAIMTAFHRGIHRLIAGERKQYNRGHKRFIKLYKDARGAGQTHYLDLDTWTYCEDKPGHFPRRLDLPSPRSRRQAHRKLAAGRTHITEVEAAHVIQRLIGPLIRRDAGGYLPSQYPGFLLRGPREITLEKAAVLVQNAWVRREEWKSEARRRNALWKIYR